MEHDIQSLKISGTDFEALVDDVKYYGEFSVYSSPDECVIDGIQINDEAGNDAPLTVIGAVVRQLVEYVSDNEYEYISRNEVAEISKKTDQLVNEEKI